MKRAIFILAFALAFSGCRDVIFDNPFDPNASRIEVKILKIMDTRLSGNGDLCFDGEKLWFASEGGTLYAVDPDSGIITRELYVGGTPSGITFFEGRLYVGILECSILVLDPLSGDILVEFPMGEKIPAFLTNFGEKLIVYDTRSSSVFEFDPDTGVFSFMFKITGFQVSGIEEWLGNIVIVERANLSIYIFRPSGEIEKTYASPTNFPGGIARDNLDNFYLFSTDGKLYKLSLY